MVECDKISSVVATLLKVEWNIFKSNCEYITNVDRVEVTVETFLITQIVVEILLDIFVERFYI